MVTLAMGAAMIGPMYYLGENGAQHGDRGFHYCAPLLFRALGKGRDSLSYTEQVCNKQTKKEILIIPENVEKSAIFVFATITALYTSPMRLQDFATHHF